jgi:hypothetical protein
MKVNVKARAKKQFSDERMGQRELASEGGEGPNKEYRRLIVSPNTANM